LVSKNKVIRMAGVLGGRTTISFDGHGEMVKTGSESKKGGVLGGSKREVQLAIAGKGAIQLIFNHGRGEWGGNAAGVGAREIISRNHQSIFSVGGSDS